MLPFHISVSKSCLSSTHIDMHTHSQTRMGILGMRLPNPYHKDTQPEEKLPGGTTWLHWRSRKMPWKPSLCMHIPDIFPFLGQLHLLSIICRLFLVLLFFFWWGDPGVEKLCSKESLDWEMSAARLSRTQVAFSVYLEKDYVCIQRLCFDGSFS